MKTLVHTSWGHIILLIGRFGAYTVRAPLSLVERQQPTRLYRPVRISQQAPMDFNFVFWKEGAKRGCDGVRCLLHI